MICSYISIPHNLCGIEQCHIIKDSEVQCWPCAQKIKFMMAKFHLTASISGSWYADSLTVLSEPLLMIVVTPVLFPQSPVKMFTFD